jgi:hypothetical protein
MLLSLLLYSDPALAAGLGNPGGLRFALSDAANRDGPWSEFRPLASLRAISSRKDTSPAPAWREVLVEFGSYFNGKSAPLAVQSVG